MADIKRSLADILELFKNGQLVNDISEQDMRDYIVSTMHNSIRIIKEEADFPTPITAPDGVLRIPLDITTTYLYDVGELEISTPFLMPERLSGLERLRMQSLTNTTFKYTGTTEPLFFGRNAGALESDKVDWVSVIPGKKCFDMVAGFGLVSITIFNTAFLDWDMGSLEGFAIFGRRFGMVRPRGPLRLHNVSRIFVDNLRFVTPPVGNANPNFILTGGDNLANPKFENTLVQTMLAGQSFFSIDKGSSYPQVGFENIPFDGQGGTFFETDLAGTLSGMADLVSLITGTVSAYELYFEDGSNFTKVTHVGHDVYVGLIVNHTGTTDYNGTHKVVRVLGLDQYVMNILHVSDESSGNYTGIGTRITTSVAHKLTDHRTTDIAGTGVIANNNWISVTFGNGLFVAVANSGTNNRIMTSPDGINWFTRISAVNNQWESITFGNGLFVAVALNGSGNRVMTSPDGINWTIRKSAADNSWTSVTFGNGLFVAVSFDGSGNRVMTSPDGINWTIRTSVANNSWIDVTFGDGLFVAVAFTGTSNRVMTSPDGINWTIQTTPVDNQWSSITFGDGLFVAVSDTGSNDRVMTSPDGINWTIQTTPVDNDWIKVTFGDDLFVAIAFNGASNQVMTSPDGINWTISITPVDNTWAGVTFGDGLFVAVSFGGTDNRVMTSPNGLLWTIRTSARVYDQTGLEVLNPNSPEFDIPVAFVSDPATGTYLTQSLDQTDVSVLAENNGALPESKKTGEVDLAPATPFEVPDSGAGFEQINGTEWTTANMEEFTATNAGVLTYVGINPATFTVIGTATIQKVSGGNPDALGMKIAKEGVVIDSSLGSTENQTPTQVTSIAIVNLAPNESVSLYVNNIGGTPNVQVDLATLLISGM